ncbi:unnamed protein product [Schistocephalus solidus]|uniref:tRNA-intron lyase n=1 Tax=Schistocephalus solidus TaxID=70667 RepID=A0A183SLK3_SCHSO|nr:unnamed protein product [Schistocephalus solidus]
MTRAAPQEKSEEPLSRHGAFEYLADDGSTVDLTQPGLLSRHQLVSIFRKRGFTLLVICWFRRIFASVRVRVNADDAAATHAGVSQQGAPSDWSRARATTMQRGRARSMFGVAGVDARAQSGGQAFVPSVCADWRFFSQLVILVDFKPVRLIGVQGTTGWLRESRENMGLSISLDEGHLACLRAALSEGLLETKRVLWGLQSQAWLPTRMLTGRNCEFCRASPSDVPEELMGALHKKTVQHGRHAQLMTTVRASQFSDAEVGAATGGLVYVYYVHDLTPKHKHQDFTHQGVEQRSHMEKEPRIILAF